jgi:hypothetical protein
MGDSYYTDKVQLYFNCPKKVEKILMLFKETNYSDLVLIVTVEHLDGDWWARDHVKPEMDIGILPVYFLHTGEIKVAPYSFDCTAHNCIQKTIISSSCKV